MSKRWLIYVIIILSSISIIALLVINYNIYLDYMNANSKTKALFGITEIIIYGNKYLLGIIPLLNVMIALIFAIKGELRQLAIVAALISLVALLFSVISLWRLFI